MGGPPKLHTEGNLQAGFLPLSSAFLPPQLGEDECLGSGCIGLGVHGRGGLCVCVCVSHCAKVFPVATSAPTPSSPHLSPSQRPAFGVHRHLIPSLSEPKAELRPLPEAGLNPTTTKPPLTPFANLSHPSKFFDLQTCLLPGFLECPGSGIFLLLILLPWLSMQTPPPFFQGNRQKNLLISRISAGLFLQGGWDPAPRPHIVNKPWSTCPASTGPHSFQGSPSGVASPAAQVPPQSLWFMQRFAVNSPPLPFTVNIVSNV